MGGDGGPAAVVAGALVAARRLQVGLLFAGSREVIAREVARHPAASSIDIGILDTPDVIGMDEAPAPALRLKTRASVRLAAEAVRAGDADAMFSAGHTGASVMAAHAVFGRMPGVERPALAATIPTRQEPAILLDSGANVECRPRHLLQFALMGSAYARVALGCSTPRVGLLSIGEEESKGNDLTREAHQLIKTAPVRFIGNIEARDLFTGNADVVVCDGFTGNVALKTGEGLAETFEHLLHRELTGTFATRVGYLLSRRAFSRFRRRVDPAEYGGAPLIGLNRLCIVGHGRSSPHAVANAITVAVRFVSERLLDRLAQQMVEVR